MAPDWIRWESGPQHLVLAICERCFKSDAVRHSADLPTVAAWASAFCDAHAGCQPPTRALAAGAVVQAAKDLLALFKDPGPARTVVDRLRAACTAYDEAPAAASTGHVYTCITPGCTAAVLPGTPHCVMHAAG